MLLINSNLNMQVPLTSHFNYKKSYSSIELNNPIGANDQSLDKNILEPKKCLKLKCWTLSGISCIMMLIINFIMLIGLIGLYFIKHKIHIILSLICISMLVVNVISIIIWLFMYYENYPKWFAREYEEFDSLI